MANTDQASKQHAGGGIGNDRRVSTAVPAKRGTGGRCREDRPHLVRRDPDDHGWVFQAFTGLMAIFNDQFLIPTREYLFQFDRTSWGWIHLVLGVVVAGAGAGLLAGRTWGRVVAIVLALCSAVVMFAFLPQYPLWALCVIALSVAVIWAVATADR
jgi:hypothetical protein